MWNEQGNVRWFRRVGVIIAAVAVLDGLAGALMRRPFPLVAIIPSMTPMLIALFDLMPMSKAGRR